MKKSYTITPDQYRENVKTQKGAAYKFGDSLDGAPDYVKERCTKAAAENLKVKLPKDAFFFKNEVLYNLWLNRDTDEPITAKELYTIVESIYQRIEDVRTTSGWDNWDGR